MPNFLMQFPKSVIVFVIISIGILFILFSNPPYTICDSQLNTLKATQNVFIYPQDTHHIKKKSEYEKLIKQCKITNSPGGCYELFYRLKILLKDLNAIPSECHEKVGDEDAIKKAIWESLELMVKIAWSTKPPASYYEKFNWLEPTDILLYCQLRSIAEKIYGPSKWGTFREKMLSQLPGISQIDRNKSWEMMLLSTNCEKYY
ncbi:MAG: hypothetical protein K1X29_11370 [Bdellovibrionales bacterium]|nr:hypothetical protein [Bdellovibrionales bacterium]